MSMWLSIFKLVIALIGAGIMLWRDPVFCVGVVLFTLGAIEIIKGEVLARVEVMIADLELRMRK